MLPAYLIMIWRNASAARSLIVVFMLVGEGDRIATAQNSANGNRGGVDALCDFRFHSAFGDLLVLPVPSELFAQRGKKV